MTLMRLLISTTQNNAVITHQNFTTYVKIIVRHSKGGGFAS